MLYLQQLSELVEEATKKITDLKLFQLQNVVDLITKDEIKSFDESLYHLPKYVHDDVRGVQTTYYIVQVEMDEFADLQYKVYTPKTQEYDWVNQNDLSIESLFGVFDMIVAEDDNIF